VGVGVGVVRVQAVPLPQAAAAPTGDVVVEMPAAPVKGRSALCAGHGTTSHESAPTAPSEGEAGRVSIVVMY
jgi:hypothetical protein